MQSIHRRARAFTIALGGAAIGSLLTSAPALADAVSPESGGSPNADRIDNLYWIIFGIGIAIFLVVVIPLIYSLVRFRAKKGAVAAQIHGNPRLEMVWTLIPALILVVLATATFVMLPGIVDPEESGPDGLASAKGGATYAVVDQPEPPKGKGLTIDVNGQQYLWRYTYPNGAYSYEEMVVPVNTTVVLNIRAQDVIHSWWIPKLGGKTDATPGYNNETWFKATKTGVYKGQCAELCGSGHANMFATVRVVEVPEYEKWVAEQKRLIDEANRAAVAQRRVIERQDQ
jgi:cytochrome c oxidase subunit 2